MTHTTQAQFYTVQGMMPGYMPNDDDPRAVEFTSALGILADDLYRTADDLLERSQLEEFYPADERAQLEAEADRLYGIAHALSEAEERLRAVESGESYVTPLSVTLEGEPYSLDYVRQFGLSVHAETEPSSLHHLGWLTELSPLPSGVRVCPECGSMLERYGTESECLDCGTEMIVTV